MEVLRGRPVTLLPSSASLLMMAKGAVVFPVLFY